MMNQFLHRLALGSLLILCATSVTGCFDGLGGGSNEPTSSEADTENGGATAASNTGNGLSKPGDPLWRGPSTGAAPSGPGAAGANVWSQPSGSGPASPPTAGIASSPPAAPPAAPPASPPGESAAAPPTGVTRYRGFSM